MTHDGHTLHVKEEPVLYYLSREQLEEKIQPQQSARDSEHLIRADRSSALSHTINSLPHRSPTATFNNLNNGRLLPRDQVQTLPGGEVKTLR